MTLIEKERIMTMNNEILPNPKPDISRNQNRNNPTGVFFENTKTNDEPDRVWFS